MPIAKALAALRAAIETEKANDHCCKVAYVMLLDGIVSFQNGEGDAPTIEQFLAWRDAAINRAQLRKAAQTESATAN